MLLLVAAAVRATASTITLVLVRTVLSARLVVVGRAATAQERAGHACKSARAPRRSMVVAAARVLLVVVAASAQELASKSTKSATAGRSVLVAMLIVVVVAASSTEERLSKSAQA